MKQRHSKISRLSLAQFLFLTGLFTSPFLSIRVNIFTLSDYLLFGSFALTIFQFKKIPSKLRLTSPYIIVIGFCLSLLSLFSALINPDPIGSLLVASRFLFLTVLLPWTLISNFDSPGLWHLPFKILRFGILCFSLSVIYSAYGSGLAFSSLSRNYGLAEHPTDAGGFLALGSVLWFCALVQKNTLPKFLGYSLILIGLILTGSISAIISTIIGSTIALAIIWKTKPSSKSSLKFGILIILGIVLIYANDVFNIKQRFNNATTGRYDTVASRFQNYSESINAITVDLPGLIFGSGLSQKNAIVQSQVAYSFAPHNYILQMLFQGGLLFTLLVLIYQISTLRNSWKSVPFVMIQLNATMASQVFFALTSPVMFSRYLWFPFVLATLIVKNTNSNNFY